MRTLELFLRDIVAITRMARGTLCVMGRTPAGKTYYNHQTWAGGRNVVRYVPPDKVRALRTTIAGHKKFLKRADEYVEAVSKRTKI